MNYISLIKRFWALNAIQLFSNAETKLYFFLLEEANRQRWPKKFSICTTTMQGMTGMSRSAICKAREALRLRGLINYVKGDHLYVKAQYSLIAPDTECIPESPMLSSEVMYDNNSQSDTPQDTPQDTLQDTLQDTPQDTIIKTENLKHKKTSKEGKKATRTRSNSICEIKKLYRQEGDDVYLKFSTWLDKNTPYIANHLEPPSPDQLRRLIDHFGPQCISDVCNKIENRRDLRTRYSSLYQTLINWCQKENR